MQMEHLTLEMPGMKQYDGELGNTHIVATGSFFLFLSVAFLLGDVKHALGNLYSGILLLPTPYTLALQ